MIIFFVHIKEWRNQLNYLYMNLSKILFEVYKNWNILYLSVSRKEI